MSARNTASTVERDIFSVGFQKSPIFLTGGLVKDISAILPVPLVTLVTEAIGVGVSDIAGAIDGGPLGTRSLDDFLMDWQPAQSSAANPVLFEVKIGEYPFANQATAGNAQISQPLSTSLLLSIPPHTVGHYTSLPLAIAAMKQIFQRHSNLGGLYHVFTPSYIWTDVILTKLTDITSDPASAPGSLFQLDFQKPITRSAQVQQSLSATLQQHDMGRL